MTGFESLVIGEKAAVVFDIGWAYTKCGFAGETGPRIIIPTRNILKSGAKQVFGDCSSSDDKRKFMIKFLYDIYYKNLLVNPKERRVVIVESILGTSAFKNLLADVIFNHFEAPSILFAPSHLMTLFTLGISTAFVLDCGFSEAQAIPIFEGYTLLNAWQTGPLGSKTVHENIKTLLLESAKCVINGVEHPCTNEMISDQVIEDIKVRTCFVSPSSRAEKWRLWKESCMNSDSNPSPKPTLYEETFAYPLDVKGNGNILQVPSEIRELAVESLFTGDNDYITLACLVLRAILLSPIDVRRTLAENIVLIGGTTIIPGLYNRLSEELELSLQLPEFEKLSALKGCFKFHKTLGFPNYVAWLGGAIFGALECLPGRSLSLACYLETKTVPDWYTNIETGVKEVLTTTNDKKSRS